MLAAAGACATRLAKAAARRRPRWRAAEHTRLGMAVVTTRERWREPAAMAPGWDASAIGLDPLFFIVCGQFISRGPPVSMRLRLAPCVVNAGAVWLRRRTTDVSFGLRLAAGTRLCRPSSLLGVGCSRAGATAPKCDLCASAIASRFRSLLHARFASASAAGCICGQQGGRGGEAGLKERLKSRKSLPATECLRS